jgi:ribosome-binding protein aMBF1 (putative translation factor)
MIEISEFIKQYEAERGVSPERIAEIQAEIDERYERWMMACDIRDRRIAKNLTQEQLAELSKIPQAMICRIEKGNANPTRDTLSRLAKALDLKLALVPVEKAAA